MFVRIPQKFVESFNFFSIDHYVLYVTLKYRATKKTNFKPTLFSEQVKKDNIENVTIDDLVAKVTPIGRQKVPSQVKEEILLRLRNFLEDE